MPWQTWGRNNERKFTPSPNAGSLSASCSRRHFNLVSVNFSNWTVSRFCVNDTTYKWQTLFGLDEFITKFIISSMINLWFTYRMSSVSIFYEPGGSLHYVLSERAGLVKRCRHLRQLVWRTGTKINKDNTIQQRAPSITRSVHFSFLRLRKYLVSGGGQQQSFIPPHHHPPTQGDICIENHKRASGLKLYNGRRVWRKTVGYSTCDLLKGDRGKPQAWRIWMVMRSQRSICKRGN